MNVVYSSLKFLPYYEQLTALRERRLVAPVHIRIKPMNYCNHNCWYCAYRYDNLSLGEGMDTADQLPCDKMFEIVEDVIEMGVRAVTFSGGGEPLLYKPLPEVVEKLAKAGIKVASLTNGSNLKGRVAEAFAKHATWLRVSVDAWDDASYGSSRGVKLGAFSKLLDNIRDFKSTGTDCVLGISLIIDNVNYTHIYELCTLFKDVGVDHIKMSPVVVGNNGDQNNQYHDEIKEVVSSQIEKARALNNETFTIVNHYHDLPTLFEKSYTSCPYLQFLTVIGADCSVYTCQDKAYTESGALGSIKDVRFKDFWFSEENKNNIFNFNPSVSCKHHCVTHTKNLAVLEYLSIDQEHGAFV